MEKTAVLVLVVAITMINQYKGEPNFACTRRDGYCSDSDRCPSLGGYVEKLAVRCKCGDACCKCTDTCPNGSSCMGKGETCNGMKDPNGCCGTRFCCTPMTTTPEPTTPIMTTTPEPCVQDCTGECMDQCTESEIEVAIAQCCGSKCCRIPFR
ncbi:keratin-associated protein 5-5-like [Mytilus californianus]|uniref:keratin-associated protein 5-5-like n=1 Tax=Mytilus californianus TaxID=6549 RepID=UPI002247A8CB|nr:keratin-associated protein 5-5-like [Mytilus californianus]